MLGDGLVGQAKDAPTRRNRRAGQLLQFESVIAHLIRESRVKRSKRNAEAPALPLSS